MTNLKSSRNYIWNSNNVLGKGATGAVYNGVNKHTGESVAVKSFNHLSHMRPYDVQEREFEVLKKVNHLNIVKLLGIEEENESRHKVLIMELCNGGSLFNILDDPVNYYGLDEKEFTTVLKHLAAGMKHLRDNNIIHRDLKPGNIMKFIGEDEISIYKLTDFGAARVLEDDQPFMSLYGTEEYLHPDMYERAVLHKSAGKSFRANVDLWSIGVTLYHIATGSLPFKPYGGRKNKETMFKITTEKQSGIISGYQLTENGEIVWSRNLPKTCLLSPALQQLVTPLLAGLLECDSSKMWSFERFFNTVTNILSHRVIYVFYVNKMDDIIIYLEKDHGMKELKHILERDLKIATKSALLLWNKQQVHSICEVQSTREDPILLLNCDVTDFTSSPILKSMLPKFPELQNTLTNCESDAQISKHYTSIAYSYKRVIDKCIHYYQLAISTPTHVISLIDGNLRLLMEKQQACSQFFNSLKHQMSYYGDVDGNLRRVVTLFGISGTTIHDHFESMKEAQRHYKNLMEIWPMLNPKMNFLHEKVKSLQRDWQNVPKSAAEDDVGTAKARAKFYCQKIRESWQALYKDKSSRVLPPAEEKLHQLEKIKIDSNSKKLTSLLRNVSYSAIEKITPKLEGWYIGAQVALKNSECLFREFTSFTSECEQLQQCINKVKEDQRSIWLICFTKFENVTGGKTSATKKICFADSSSVPNIKEDIHRLKKEREELFSMVNEHCSLVSEIDSIQLSENTNSS